MAYIFAERMQAERRVDIIVPAHNRCEWLRECLQSVLNQAHINLTLIVVDDGSEPPLAKDIRLADIVSDARVHLLAKPNGGPASARNLGLDAARGEYVLLLDSDDILEASAIEILLGALRNSGADFAAGAWANFSSDLKERVVTHPDPTYGDPYANCVACGWVAGSVMMRNDRTNRYNERRMPWEALEFYLDYLAPGRSAVYVDDVIVNMRQHNDPDRLTIRHHHFEPMITGRFFAEKKRQLMEGSLLNDERAAALDARILGCIHSLLRAGRPREAGQLFETVSWERVASYPWLRTGSFAWCARRLGFLGAKSFIAANRIIGRA